MQKNRRPLISLTDAIYLYNFSPVPRPVFTDKGHCQWCNEKIQGNRKKSFCCKEHSDDFHRLVTWSRTRSAYSNHIVWRDKLTCQDCGEVLAFKNCYDIYIPLECGAEVHHIIPVEEGGTDDPRNLITLCHKCHKERHEKLKQYKVDVNDHIASNYLKHLKKVKDGRQKEFKQHPEIKILYPCSPVKLPDSDRFNVVDEIEQWRLIEGKRRDFYIVDPDDRIRAWGDEKKMRESFENIKRQLSHRIAF